MPSSSDTGIFTVRIPKNKQKQLDTIAASLDRPRSWVINQAIDDYLEAQIWQIEEIKKALKEADNGDFASEKVVAALFKKYAD